MYEQLAQHRLLSAVDRCLEVEGAVTCAELAERAEAVLAGFEVMDFIEVRVRGIPANLVKAGFNPPGHRPAGDGSGGRSWPDLESDAVGDSRSPVLEWLREAARLTGGVAGDEGRL